MGMLATLVQEEKDGGIGEVLLWAIFVIAIVTVVAFLVGILPALLATRHGWRWTLAVVALALAASLPLRIAGVLAADKDADALRETWGWVSFPMWVVLAVAAWMGPPGWLPWLHHRTAAPEEIRERL